MKNYERLLPPTLKKGDMVFSYVYATVTLIHRDAGTRHYLEAKYGNDNDDIITTVTVIGIGDNDKAAAVEAVNKLNENGYAPYKG